MRVLLTIVLATSVFMTTGVVLVFGEHEENDAIIFDEADLYERWKTMLTTSYGFQHMGNKLFVTAICLNTLEYEKTGRMPPASLLHSQCAVGLYR